MSETQRDHENPEHKVLEQKPLCGWHPLMDNLSFDGGSSVLDNTFPKMGTFYLPSEEGGASLCV
jgi:hypothetical protein